jgi:HEAT repeat protein
MTASQNDIAVTVAAATTQSRLAGKALSELYKALKSVGFYPTEHPLRNENIIHAYRTLLQLLKDQELVLVVTRQGFSANEGGVEVEGNAMTQALARELFIRRILRLTFLRDLSLTDLRELLLILSLEAQKIGTAGGVARQMADRGITTVWVNELELPIIWQKRQAMAAALSHPLGEVGEDGAAVRERIEEADKALEELLALMEAEDEDNRYQQLGRQLVARSETLKTESTFAPLLPVLEVLLRHHQDDNRSLIQREYAVFSLQQVAEGAMAEYLLLLLEDKEFIDQERLYPLLRILGEKAVYGIIQRICLADRLVARKSLATALVSIGLPAIPPLLAMLKDERWYVVRNMVSILGELRSADCLPALRAALYHEDQRVRKETVRSLVKIGGREAESMIVPLLDEKDPAMVRHAVLFLGLMKSPLAVQPLLQIVEKRDLLLRGLTLKKEALQALGRIGDKRATQPLLRLFAAGGGWLGWSKREEFRIELATTLGFLGDEAALAVLKEAAQDSGHLGEACSEAIDNIERLAEGSHD